MTRFRCVGTVLAGAAVTWAAAPANAVTFNISSTGNAQADAGFAAAAQLWSDRLANDITVNITAAFNPLGPGILGAASSTQTTYNYNSVRGSLVTNATSADDLSSSAVLSPTSVDMLINRTSNNPNGPGSSIAYQDNDGDANNTNIRIANANAKALGLLAANNAASDAQITFSSNFTFDFDRSDGIAGNAYDFVGVAAHEIGHALGFISGVDILDINSPPYNGPFSDNQFTYVSTLDLFRFSADSTALGVGVIDWTADARAKYFSVDGGATAVAGFSGGDYFGGGEQASHWLDHMSFGIMDPTLANGQLAAFTSNDLRAFDVIGYQIVPEPAGLSLLAFGAFAVARRRRDAVA